jgi:AraC-like DNA-binding protein
LYIFSTVELLICLSISHQNLVSTYMKVAFVSPPIDIGHLVSGSLWVSLPAEPYVVPATMAPLLLYVLTGNLVMADAIAATGQSSTGTPCPLPRFSVCGGTRGVRHLHATPGTHVLLTPVRPGQCARLLGLPAGELFEHLVDGAELLPVAQMAQLHGHMDSIWHSAGANHPDAQAAITVWHSFLCELHHMNSLSSSLGTGLVVPPGWLDTPVPTLAQQWGLSLRQFERQFQVAHGQSLRAYRQQSRCSRLLTQLSGVLSQPLSWADTAASAGYADQAHLSRDILRFTGHTPAALLAGVRAKDPALWPFHVSPQVMPRWFGPHGY